MKENEERAWTNENIDNIAMKHFPNANREAALKRPILYSNWLSKDYMPVEQERLREYVQARLKVVTLYRLSRCHTNDRSRDFVVRFLQHMNQTQNVGTHPRRMLLIYYFSFLLVYEPTDFLHEVFNVAV